MIPQHHAVTNHRYVSFLNSIEPIAPEPTKRSVGSSSSANPNDLEDDSEQEDDDLGKEEHYPTIYIAGMIKQQ